MVTLTDEQYGRAMWALAQIACGDAKADRPTGRRRVTREQMRGIAADVCRELHWPFDFATISFHQSI